jgi:hypothetical protein
MIAPDVFHHTGMIQEDVNFIEHDSFFVTWRNVERHGGGSRNKVAERLGKSTETPAPERYLPGETSEAARARRRRPAARKDNNPGLSTSLLIKPNPDWASLKAADIVNVEADQKHWSLVAKALMCRVLKKYFPNEMKQSEKEAGIAPISMPQLYKITPGASDMYTLATLDIDEGTIDGNIDVLETVATEQLGLTLDGMADGCPRSRACERPGVVLATTLARVVATV